MSGSTEQLRTSLRATDPFCNDHDYICECRPVDVRLALKELDRLRAIDDGINKLCRTERDLVCIGHRRDRAGQLTYSVIVAGTWCGDVGRAFRADTLAEALASAVAARKAAEQEA